MIIITLCNFHNIYIICLIFFLKNTPRYTIFTNSKNNIIYLVNNHGLNLLKLILKVDFVKNRRLKNNKIQKKYIICKSIQTSPSFQVLAESLSTFLIVTFERNIILEWDKKKTKAKKCSFSFMRKSQIVQNSHFIRIFLP